MTALAQKQERLFEILSSMEKVLVAYSGGTDSAYLAWAATQVLGDSAIAITADSASIPESHKQYAATFAEEFGIKHKVIQTHEFENPDYVRNDSNRCYHCKDELFECLIRVGEKMNIPVIAYGVNKDDTEDFRPGHRAAQKHEIRAPLLEAEMTKSQIRELSREAGLPSWDRPAAACLSSRIPYGTEVTPERVKLIEQGEEALAQLGFRVFRVRYHGKLARIEIGQQELEKALNVAMAKTLVRIFHDLGFQYVTLDLAGYRQGSLNEVLPASDTSLAFRILS